METRSQALKGVFATWKARLLVGTPVGAGIYQFGCDQFDWPKLPALWGMTGQLIPWWGWLIVALAGSVFALFEYVRRNVGSNPTDDGTATPAHYDDANLRGEVEALQAKLAKFEAEVAELAIRNRFEFERTRNKVLAEISSELSEYHRQISAYEGSIESYKNNTSRVSGMPPSSPNVPLTLMGKLTAIGVTGEEFNAAVMARNQEIDTQNSFVILDPVDPMSATWKDGVEKKKWHKLRAKAYAIDKIISGLTVPDSKLTDDALTSAITFHRMHIGGR